MVHTLIFAEGQCTIRPYVFSGANYTQWKVRMMLHVRPIDYKVSRIIEHSDLIPMDFRTNEPKNEWIAMMRMKR